MNICHGCTKLSSLFFVSETKYDQQYFAKVIDSVLAERVSGSRRN